MDGFTALTLLQAEGFRSDLVCKETDSQLRSKSEEMPMLLTSTEELQMFRKPLMYSNFL